MYLDKMYKKILVLLVCFFAFSVLIGAEKNEPCWDQVERMLVRPDANMVLAEQAKQKIEKMQDSIAKDQRALLKGFVDSYRNSVRDYTGVLTKRERIRGKLSKEQLIEFRFREKPYSVYLRWLKNPIGADKLLYVEGENGGLMRVHPTALFGLVPPLSIDPNSEKAMKDTLYPCTSFGFGRMLERLLRSYDRAVKQGKIRTEYMGVTLVDGRLCGAWDNLLPAAEQYGIRRILVQFDVQWQFPVSLMTFDSQGGLIGFYEFVGIKLNVGLGDKDFDRKKLGL